MKALKSAIYIAILAIMLTSCKNSIDIGYESDVSGISYSSESVSSEITLQDKEAASAAVSGNSSHIQSSGTDASSEVSSSQANITSEQSESSEQKLYVSFSIIGLYNDVIFSSEKQEISEGISVFDLTKKICSENGIDIKTKSGGYISSIEDYKEKSPTSTAGWTYSVNSIIASKGSSKYKLHGGETVEWVFKK